MVANILPAEPPDPKGQKVKIQLFQINVLYILINGITNAATLYPRCHMFYIGLYWENMEKYSCLLSLVESAVRSIKAVLWAAWCFSLTL